MNFPKKNQKSYIDGQTIQWPKEKGQKEKKTTLHRKIKIEQHAPTPPKAGVTLGRFERISSVCSRRVTGKRHEHALIWK